MSPPGLFGCKPLPASTTKDVATLAAVKTGFFLPQVSGQNLYLKGKPTLKPQALAAKLGVAVKDHLYYSVTTSATGEQILLVSDGGVERFPLASLGIDGKEYAWHISGLKRGERVAFSNTYVRDLATRSEPEAWVAPDGNDSNIFMVKRPLNSAGIHEPVLINYVDLLETPSKARLYRLGNSIIAEDTNRTALSFDELTRGVWRVSGTYEDALLRAGSLIWTVNFEDYFALREPGSGQVSVWRKQDKDSMAFRGNVPTADANVPDSVSRAAARQQNSAMNLLGGTRESDEASRPSFAGMTQGVAYLYPFESPTQSAASAGFALADPGSGALAPSPGEPDYQKILKTRYDQLPSVTTYNPGAGNVKADFNGSVGYGSAVQAYDKADTSYVAVVNRVFYQNIGDFNGSQQYAAKAGVTLIPVDKDGNARPDLGLKKGTMNTLGLVTDVSTVDDTKEFERFSSLASSDRFKAASDLVKSADANMTAAEASAAKVSVGTVAGDFAGTLVGSKFDNVKVLGGGKASGELSGIADKALLSTLKTGAQEAAKGLANQTENLVTGNEAKSRADAADGLTSIVTSPTSALTDKLGIGGKVVQSQIKDAAGDTIKNGLGVDEGKFSGNASKISQGADVADALLDAGAGKLGGPLGAAANASGKLVLNGTKAIAGFGEAESQLKQATNVFREQEQVLNGKIINNPDMLQESKNSILAAFETIKATKSEQLTVMPRDATDAAAMPTLEDWGSTGDDEGWDDASFAEVVPDTGWTADEAWGE